MSTLTNFSDDFSSYTPGTTNLTGWINNFQGLTQFATVVDFGTQTGSSSATGFFERSGHGALLNNEAIVFQDINNQADVVGSQIVWAGFSAGNRTPMIYVDNVNLSSGTSSNPTQFANLGGLIVNTDYTMSFICPSTQSGGLFQGAAYIATTTNQVVFPYTWQYFQAQFLMSTILLSGTTYVKIACTLLVNGTQVLNGTGIPNINITSLWTTPTPAINQWRFSGGPGYIGEMTNYIANGTSTLPPIATWPAPGTPLQARVTQGMVELAAKNDVRAGRVTQGVVEIPAIPNLRYARVTQGVVEIVARFFSPNTWYVFEA